MVFNAWFPGDANGGFRNESREKDFFRVRFSALRVVGGSDDA
jgi:hypothetical protein